MKVRKKTLCHTCRRRKLACDGKRPACSQCLRSDRRCEGYPDVLFMPVISGPRSPKPTPSRPARSSTWTHQSQAPVTSPDDASAASINPTGNKTDTPSSSCELVSGSRQQRQTRGSYAYPVNPSLSDPLQSTMSLIIRNYVPHSEISGDVAHVVPQSPRICGSWVTTLPMLTASATGPLSECLGSAMKALAMSIMSYRTGGRLVQSISLRYGHTLRLLQHDLQLSGTCYKIERVASVMCLALVEILSPTSPLNWLVHMHGVSELIRLSPPRLFSTGIQHKLFIGIRPLMVLEALIFRKATFLAEEEWTRMPFQHHEPSPLQSLLSLTADMPAILARIDGLENEPTSTGTVAANKRLIELTEMREKLEAWSLSFYAESSAPLYWHRASQDEDHQRKSDSLWFASLTAANVLTHLWSLKITCLSHIQELLTRFPELERFSFSSGNLVGLRETCIELSVNIFHSTEYLMQDKFMLYGPFTAGLPVYTAHKALEMDDQGRAILQKLDKSIMDRISGHLIIFLQQHSCRHRNRATT
ncbi:hypothetical protein NM208_g6111 [Fusarium decemcellulare]|uniref:Uncharacterized protein n=2 Tax=Fusarium decemcellulare TaxID=57161 RepID=A0ACC1SE98_9HYPO|nr:hypothetical protein NM208_g9501 [Fusarium decemcellulare]KAJ3537945.1 hypothetical protein NM208_g6111 [Fusarium decemcellulare]